MKIGDITRVERYLILPRWFKGRWYWLQNVCSKYEYVQYKIYIADSISGSPEVQTVEEWKLIEIDSNI